MKQGNFAWFELMTTDLPAAERFYGDVVGWRVADSGMPDRRYTILSAGAIGVGGAMALTPDMLARGARSGWMGYVLVADVDAAAAKLTAAGGVIHRPAEDIPGIGRFAVAADPWGAIFILFHGSGEPPPHPGRWAPGGLGWAELQAPDPDAALDFYTGLLGWTRGEIVDAGELGPYRLFETDLGAIGGVMAQLPEVPFPFWLYYFNVSAVAAAAGRVTAAGGQVLSGPREIPGGAWIAHCLDPQGALFALVGPAHLVIGYE